LRTGVASSKSSSSSFGAQLQAEAAAIERWWAQPRWQHTKRIYSGKCVGHVCRR
jgi:Isocitrate lyase family